MAADENLATYLNDHLSGATAAVDLAEKSASQNEGTPFGTFMADLKTAIDEDRGVLVTVMERLDIDTATVKQATGRLFEKVSRLRLHDAVTGDPVLSRLMELEALDMGVTGKLALWRTLQEVAATDTRLAQTDLDTPIKRARAQLQQIEEHHRETARAFAA
ncbi:MAG: hypothetical protein M3179_11890 [Actinomycetota bacterium]|nr:hypothetical protein [Actinomycetota bacterium]